MSSNPQDEASLENGHSHLEDRLRGLILNNRQNTAPTAQGSPTPVDAEMPSFRVAATNVQREESRTQLSSEAQSAVVPPRQLPHGSRKRLNQAQRRQMSSQISIPVDSRLLPEGNQTGRGFSPSTGFGWQPNPQGSAARQQDRTRYPPPQYPVPSRGPSLISFHSPQERNQHQYINPVAHQAHNVQRPGNVHHFPTQHPGAQQTQHFRGNRIREHHHALTPDQISIRPAPEHNQLFQPGPYNSRGYGTPPSMSLEQIAAQSSFLHVLLDQHIPKIMIGEDEVQEKERFRVTIEQICREAILNYEIIENNIPKFNAASVELKCFGSMASGFATNASDMDLALLAPHSKPPPNAPESPIPHVLEKKLLDMGFGARLLTKTRVPIIKLCQKPTAKLLNDLREERRKWENGLIGKEINESEQGKEAGIKYELGGNAGKKAVGENNGKLAAATYQENLASLRQNPKDSLMDFYGSANRLLRKLGSRDIDRSHSTPPEQIRVVHDVCKAFVNGLYDADLRASLSNYKALLFSDTDELANMQSLRGVFTQIEGEQLALAWDNRPLREATAKLEADGQRQVDEWRKLVERTDVAPVIHNGMLHHAVSRLKRIPSLQLLSLEQGSHESPKQYYLRAATILKALRSQSDDNVLPVVIAHYVDGIGDTQVQKALKSIKPSNKLVTLPELAMQHRIIQLAHDYESALSKNLYGKQDGAEVEQYLNFLRSHAVDYANQLTGSQAIHVAIDKTIADLCMKVRNLPDPTYGLNKPRDRYKDHLEFPKTDIGIQCDINFSAQLGLHNTLLLRCYSLTDSRVRPLILFIKYWARVRAINTPYRGSLSSYGYVLMVLHYLVNVATPFVCPNLQLLQQDPPQYLSPDEIASQTTCNGYDVRFWRNEEEIASLAQCGRLNHNRDSLGRLLHGFFEYYAQNGPLSNGGRSFDWGRDVLSLRTQSGLLTKQQKGWVGARTVTETRTEATPLPASTLEPPSTEVSANVQPVTGLGAPRKPGMKEEVKEIRHRYLFAIEDPFELDHNVARTVTHDGIVAIREEFRRAWRIITNVGKGEEHDGLLSEAVTEAQPKGEFEELMDLLHGKMEHKR